MPQNGFMKIINQKIMKQNNPVCPICQKVENTENIKICPDCQAIFEDYSGDPEVELVKEFCNN